LRNNPIRFDGGRSFDIDGAVVSYVWDFGGRLHRERSGGFTLVHSAWNVHAEIDSGDDKGATGTDVATISIGPFPSTERVSVSSAGVEANEDSGGTVVSGDVTREISISADGRFVAFTSRASNLVPNDTNDSLDVFVRDRQSGYYRTGQCRWRWAQGNFASFQPSISADGRYIAFSSYSTTFVAPNSPIATGHVQAPQVTCMIGRPALRSSLCLEHRSASPFVVHRCP